jgi:zinc transport system substrate-binding protein
MNIRHMFKQSAVIPAVVILTTALAQGQPIVVTTTMLETAVRELTGDSADVVRLLPPGSCPGHFDLDPGQVRELSDALLFIRHDFQAGLDDGIRKSGLGAEQIVSMKTPEALTIPVQYFGLCKTLTESLCRALPDQADQIRKNLQGVREKILAADQSSRARCGRLRGRKVLAAVHQRDFCRWMGLDVVAVFHAGTDESAWQLARAVDMAKSAGAEVVVGNYQWGPRHLEALCENTRLAGIMLSNFPSSGEPGAYWTLLENNLSAVLRGLP